jgi:hypothetical protein
MRQDPDEERASPRSDRTASRADRAAAGGQEGHKLFPYQTVVGVIDDPTNLETALEGLVEGGFGEADVHVLCGARGVAQIDAKGKRKGLLARLFRVVDGLGEEREHTERHVKELEAGHFIVVVESPDEVTKARARDGLAAHGGHFINYYSRWSTENLAP